MSQHQDTKGNWYVMCTNPTTGKQTCIRVNPVIRLNFKTKKEAKEFEVSYLKSRYDINMNFETLFNYYHESFLLSNPHDYDLMSWYNNHLCRFNKRKIVSLKPADLVKVQVEMKSKGYSHHYINKIVGLVNTVLNFGVAQGYMDNNPCKTVKPLKIIKVNEEETYWTNEQFKTVINSLPELFDEAEAEYIKLLFMFTYFTGIRCGELRALKWKKINFEQRKIIIDQHIAKNNTLKPGRKNGDQLIIYMDDNTYDILQGMKKIHEGYGGVKRENYVFFSYKEGIQKPIGSNTPNKWVKKLADYNDLPHITFHGLRHSCASYLISIVGLTPYEVADRLGDTVEIVLDVYASFFNESKKSAATKISQYSDDFKGYVDPQEDKNE